MVLTNLGGLEPPKYKSRSTVASIPSLPTAPYAAYLRMSHRRASDEHISTNIEFRVHRQSLARCYRSRRMIRRKLLLYPSKKLVYVDRCSFLFVRKFLKSYLVPKPPCTQKGSSHDVQIKYCFFVLSFLSNFPSCLPNEVEMLSNSYLFHLIVSIS